MEKHIADDTVLTAENPNDVENLVTQKKKNMNWK